MRQFIRKLRILVWIGLMILALYLVAISDLSAQGWMAVAFLVLVLIWGVQLVKRRPLSPLAQLDRMSPQEFEIAIGKLLEVLGWEVLKTGGGDQQIDIIARKHGNLTGIEVKHRLPDNSVSKGHITRAEGDRRQAGCALAIVITNGYFTNPAIGAARALGITLWNREALSSMIEEANITWE